MRKADIVWEMNEMWRCHGPRGQLINTDPGLDRTSIVGATDRRDQVDNEIALDTGLAVEFRHPVDKALNSILHQAASAFWRIDTNRAPFLMVTSSSDVKRLVVGCSLPWSSPKS